MNISFSPPDITEEEIQAVSEALRSGWITIGPRTKEFERNIAQFVGCNRADMSQFSYSMFRDSTPSVRNR